MGWLASEVGEGVGCSWAVGLDGDEGWAGDVMGGDGVILSCWAEAGGVSGVIEPKGNTSSSKVT